MKILKLSLLFILLHVFTPHLLTNNYTHQLIVWNVGQGQWLTYIKNNHCYHMDMGGEFAPLRRVLKYCKQKDNIIYISHADRDHINFYGQFTKNVKFHCLVKPNDDFLRLAKLNKKKVTLCPKQINSPIKTIYSPRHKKVKNRNELSKVFIVEGKVLNPGDSLNKNELSWARKNKLKNITILILGHHGSLTSNSNYLIKKLPLLKLTIASARKKRYGHPHGRVRLRFKLNQTPVLSTEHWSHISISL